MPGANSSHRDLVTSWLFCRPFWPGLRADRGPVLLDRGSLLVHVSAQLFSVRRDFFRSTMVPPFVHDCGVYKIISGIQSQ